MLDDLGNGELCINSAISCLPSSFLSWLQRRPPSQWARASQTVSAPGTVLASKVSMLQAPNERKRVM